MGRVLRTIMTFWITAALAVAVAGGPAACLWPGRALALPAALATPMASSQNNGAQNSPKAPGHPQVCCHGFYTPAVLPVTATPLYSPTFSVLGPNAAERPHADLSLDGLERPPKSA